MIVYWVQDLLFMSKLRETARQLGTQARALGCTALANPLLLGALSS